MKKKEKKIFENKRAWLLSAFILVVIVGGAILMVKKYAVDSFTENSFTLYVYPETTYTEILDQLEAHIERPNMLRFRRIARMDNYETKIIPGSYKLDPTMSPIDVYRVLSRGLQTPIKFRFNNVRTIEQFAGRASSQLMMDSIQVMDLFNDLSFVEELGFTNENIAALFLPDTYEFYWTITANELFARMKKEYDRFWSKERKNRAQAIGFSPIELSIIASISEEETNDTHERGVVARLYMNRLNINMPLQADPTVKFAVGDFTIRRVLHKHLATDSPYNTYMYGGLPPGPIRIVSKQTIDTILASESHQYIYMCAKEDFSGRHNFSISYSEHQNNAARYRKALNERNIR